MKTEQQIPSHVLMPRRLKRATRLLLTAWWTMQSLEQRKLDQQAVGQYLGVAGGTFADWISEETETTQLEALLRALERLPEASRETFLSPFLREFPTFNSRRLAHDPLSVSRLRALLQLRSGVTFITGERDDLRSFVALALGHEASRVGSTVKPVPGVDLLCREAFVPVPGVLQVPADGMQRPDQLRTQLLSQLHAGQPGCLVLVNGLWTRFPQVQKLILNAARQRHVVLADNVDLHRAKLRQQLKLLGLPWRGVLAHERSPEHIGVEFLGFSWPSVGPGEGG